MPLNHHRSRFAVRKFWYENRSIGGKIRPTYIYSPDRMNEEFRQASDIAKDPASVSWLALLWVMLLSTLGGVVRVIREAKLGGKTWKQILVIFISEIIVSVFTGMLTFFICSAREMPPMYTAALVSVASYMGGRALSVIEALYKAKICKED